MYKGFSLSKVKDIDLTDLLNNPRGEIGLSDDIVFNQWVEKAKELGCFELSLPKSEFEGRKLEDLTYKGLGI